MASRRCLTKRAWSVRLIEPSSIIRFWIFSILCILDINNTNTVPATVLITTGPRPRFTRSRVMITSFLKGVLNNKTNINTTSENITVNKRCCIDSRWQKAQTFHNKNLKNCDFYDEIGSNEKVGMS